MKLNPTGLPTVGSSVQQNLPVGRKGEGTPVGKTASVPAAPASSSDSVELSSQAALLARAEAKMNEVPEIDWQRVEELRSAIQSGQFRVHPERIADRLLAEVDHLLQPQSP